MKSIRNWLENNLYYVALKYFIFQTEIFLKSLNKSLLCLFFISTFISLVIELWSKHKDAGINDVLTNLAYSYISAYVFYILVIFFPYHRKRRTLAIFIHNRTGFIHQIIWKAYELVLSKSRLDPNKRNEYKGRIPSRDELSAFLQEANCFQPVTYYYPSLMRSSFSDYDDLIIEAGNTILIYVNDLIKFQDFMESQYFTKLIELENQLLINVRILNGQRARSADINSLSYTLMDLLSLTKALRELEEKMTIGLMKERRYLAQIRSLKERKGGVL